MNIINDIIINNSRKHPSNIESNTTLDIQTCIENNTIVKSKTILDNDHDKDLNYVIVCKKYPEKEIL